METKFNFNSAICTSLEQSRKLLALGLKKETADMSYRYQRTSGDYELSVFAYEDILRLKDRMNNRKVLGMGWEEMYGKDIPAWSMHRLIEMMPKCVRAHSDYDDSQRLHPYVPKFDYQGVTIENIDETLADFYQHTDLFDNIIDCIEWLIKEGYFNKEYLN